LTRRRSVHMSHRAVLVVLLLATGSCRVGLADPRDRGRPLDHLSTGSALPPSPRAVAGTKRSGFRSADEPAPAGERPLLRTDRRAAGVIWDLVGWRRLVRLCANSRKRAAAALGPRDRPPGRGSHLRRSMPRDAGWPHVRARRRGCAGSGARSRFGGSPRAVPWRP
jgi:hypothetical protein